MNTEQQKPHLSAVPTTKKKPNPIPEPLTIGEILKMKDAEWIIEDLISQNSLSMLYGEPGCGKSFIALDLAHRICVGQSWNEKKVNAGGVLYLAGEGAAGLKKRVSALIQTDPRILTAPIAFWPIAPSIFEDAENMISRLLEFKKGNPLDLLIIDTLSRTFGGRNENDAADMPNYIRQIDRIKEEAGCAVMLVHHSGKDSARGARGHSSLLGATDAAIEVQKGGVLKVSKQKDGEELPRIGFSLMPQGESCIVGWMKSGDMPVAPKAKAPRGENQKFLLNLIGEIAKNDPHYSDAAPTGRPVVLSEILLQKWSDVRGVKKSSPSLFRSVVETLKDGGYIDGSGVEVWLK